MANERPQRPSVDDGVSPVDRPTPSRGGRPSSLTPRVRKVIVAAVAKGASYRLAALAAGVSPDAFMNWRKLGANGDPRYAAFVRELGVAEAKAAERWLDQISAAAERGSWQAAAWMLERRYRNEYAQRSEVSGPDGGVIPLPTNPPLTVEERTRRIAGIMGAAIARRATGATNGNGNGHAGSGAQL